MTPEEFKRARNEADEKRQKRRAQWCANPPKEKPESANRITANVIKVINMQPGCYAFRVNNVGVWDAAKGIYRKGNTVQGISDVIACVRGRMVCIEVKAGKDRMSAGQLIFSECIRQSAGHYIIARTTDGFLSDLSQLLDEIEQGRK